jgi:hypothetical protein
LDDRRLKGDEIPPDDHVAIHWQPMDFESSPDGGRVALKSDAFAARVHEDGISANWVEYAALGTFEEQLADTGKLLATQRCVRKNHRCGVMNVGQIKSTSAALQRPLAVVHDPIEDPPPNPAHTLIEGASLTDVELLQALSLLVTLHPFTVEAVATSKKLFGG